MGRRDDEQPDVGGRDIQVWSDSPGLGTPPDIELDIRSPVPPQDVPDDRAAGRDDPEGRELVGWVRSLRTGGIRPAVLWERAAPARNAFSAWSARPTGRLVITGVVIALMLAGAATAGAYVVPPRAVPAAAPSATASASASASPTRRVSPTRGVNPTRNTFPTRGVPTMLVGRPADAYAAWAVPMGGKLDIPAVALQAYAYAELVTSQRRPTCKLSWTLLAGIGKIESNHGRVKGASLNPDGRALPSIVGPPLDGQSGRKSIPDTDSGRLDGDRSWDRAVGPMQFIPTTWDQYSVDADRDQLRDPNDIDDAALAAADYLCAGSRDLSTTDGWWSAVQSYNVPENYQQDVFNAANDYGRRSRT